MPQQPDHDKTGLHPSEIKKLDGIEDGLHDEYPALENTLREARLLGGTSLSDKITDWAKANEGWSVIIAIALLCLTCLAFR